MKPLISSLSKYLSTFRRRLTLAVASTLVLCACGTTPTPAVLGQCPPIPVVDSSLLQKAKGLAAFQLPSPSASLQNQAATQVQLSEVGAQHVQEAAYTHWLEIMLAGWQKWYADLQKSYGPVSGPQ